ncbi:RNA-binding protein [Fructilactobacillus lindneri]|uniref:RNA-binding S4 domain-containing protein n=1 Tax=Fructilactobacillus lindneri DSM 20690 = JCM 11027 TaxID=1122148 RepID=A0A0R2JUR3_9LACO|nr:YlmH/Sll1252 family protein [Fructilactobacillus lindneri]ANZ58013.1 RNA-binding protein [Fructilactobacillus lindneri]KRN78359.1 hypothetical protein IV52_GL001297 [Fructilactobacillus lindneri DSM 20690 = JCM 11027]POG98880.1 RNA-binding protein [Fructilactobacillus lindneri]POH05381.1 RNA-binding protein [Fructilactobacillus lindneri]POH05963.1 RNA-binding protein [Fructilactobacillus lindneri]
MTLDKNIQQHFRKDELPFMHQSSDLINQALSEYRPILTGFVNNQELYLLEILVNRYDDLKISSWGGYKNAEMQRAIIYPLYFEPQRKDFEVSIISISYPIKFATLKHSQILGTLMGSGIERNVIGDIITDKEQWQFFVEANMVDFLVNNVNHIGRTKVNLTEDLPDNVLQVNNDAKTVNVTLPSLRLDVVVASIFNISRSIAKELIIHDKVRLNWFTYDKPDYILAVHDLISIRGFGRVRFNKNNGLSKKGKLKVEFDVIKNK